MGVSATASTPTASDQAALERDLETRGLCANLRMCKMIAWKETFEACTGQNVIDWEWSTAPVNVVAEWAEHDACRRPCLTLDEKHMCIYLSVCKKHAASIVFD